ncbi:MAG: ABC-2 family transporter protein [Pirellulales bacterium]
MVLHHQLFAYPSEIFAGTIGGPLRFFCTYVIPVLIVVNVPARLLALPFDAGHARLALYGAAATAGSLFVSRRVFLAALRSYRSASS